MEFCSQIGPLPRPIISLDWSSQRTDWAIKENQVPGRSFPLVGFYVNDRPTRVSTSQQKEQDNDGGRRFLSDSSNYQSVTWEIGVVEEGGGDREEQEMHKAIVWDRNERAQWELLTVETDYLKRGNLVPCHRTTRLTFDWKQWAVSPSDLLLPFQFQLLYTQPATGIWTYKITLEVQIKPRQCRMENT